jgi:hypothetical protein
MKETRTKTEGRALGECVARALGVLCLFLALCAPLAAQTRLTRYVDPFVGMGGHGHTFPGATVPFGMVQLSPDTRLTGWDGCSGYHYSDSVVYGFSHTHLSGTGVSDYGDVLLMPTAGPVFLKATDGGSTERGYASRFSHRRETASPGYYAVRLDDENIFAELTATKRAGLHRYTYPATGQANVILDLAHRDRVLDSSLRVVGDRTLEGRRRSEAWARDQVVYFVAEFSEPFDSFGVALDESPAAELREARGRDIRAFFRFPMRRGGAVSVRVGISAVDVEGARQNVYVQSATLDGRPFTRSFIRHEEVMRGGELVFRMGDRPNRAWGSGDRDVPVSSIDDGPFVPVPTVNAAKNTFRERLRVRLDSAGPRARIFYTLDGTEPDENSTPYEGEFDIERSTVVKAVAVEDGGRKSKTAAASFQRIAHERTVKLLSRYSPQYTAGGDEGLIDGVRGNTHFGGGAWQGFQGQDFEAVVDLGRVETVTKLGAGFLQNVGSWIFMPTRVEFALSADGVQFLHALTIDNDVPDTNRDVVVKDFVRGIPPAKARFVRVKAYNYGKLPAWHPGAGSDAYVFVDEIIIE